MPRCRVEITVEASRWNRKKNFSGRRAADIYERRFSFNNKIAEIFRATKHTRMKNGKARERVKRLRNTMGDCREPCFTTYFWFIYGLKMNSIAAAERDERRTRATKGEQQECFEMESFGCDGLSRSFEHLPSRFSRRTSAQIRPNIPTSSVDKIAASKTLRSRFRFAEEPGNLWALHFHLNVYLFT